MRNPWHGRHPHHHDQGIKARAPDDPGFERILRAAVRNNFPAVARGTATETPSGDSSRAVFVTSSEARSIYPR